MRCSVNMVESKFSFTVLIRTVWTSVFIAEAFVEVVVAIQFITCTRIASM